MGILETLNTIFKSFAQDPADCHEHIVSTTFWICDDDNDAPAYTSLDEPKPSALKVETKSIITNFFAVDNCLISKKTQCDALLAHNQDRNLCWVELKLEVNNMKSLLDYFEQDQADL
jgi:hypothetical protein